MHTSEPPSGPAGDLPADPFGAGGLGAALARWAAEAAVDEAARSRARARWLEQQAAEETTFASVLADLAERDRPVLVHTGGSRRHRGRLTALGVDFVALRTDAGTDVLVRLDAVTAVRTQPREQQAHSGRLVAVELRLAETLAVLVADRPRVTIGTATDDTFNGELVSVGSDVVTLRIDGDTRAHVYVPLGAVVDLAVAIA